MVKGFEVEQDLRMNVGETSTIGGYTFRFDGVREIKGPNYMAARGMFHVTKGGHDVTDMFPEKRHYTVQNQTMTEAAIDSGLLRDLYVSLGEPLDWGSVERTAVPQALHRLDLGRLSDHGIGRGSRDERSPLSLGLAT